MEIQGKIKGKYKEFFKHAKKYAKCIDNRETYFKSGLRDHFKELVEDVEELFKLYKKLGVVPMKLKNLKARLRTLFEKYEAGGGDELDSWDDTIRQAKLVRSYVEGVKDLWKMKAVSHGFDENEFDKKLEKIKKAMLIGISNAKHHRAFGG